MKQKFSTYHFFFFCYYIQGYLVNKPIPAEDFFEKYM